MSEFLELQSYQPSFYQDILEMSEIMKASGMVLDSQVLNVKSIENNSFLVSLELWGVERWEKILKIFPSSSQSFEERRSKIQAELRRKYPLSKTTILGMMNSYNSNLGGRVTFEDSTIWCFFNVQEGSSITVTEFYNIMELRKPSHLDFEVGNLVSETLGVDVVFSKWKSQCPISSLKTLCGTLPISIVKGKILGNNLSTTDLTSLRTGIYEIPLAGTIPEQSTLGKELSDVESFSSSSTLEIGRYVLKVAGDSIPESTQGSSVSNDSSASEETTLQVGKYVEKFSSASTFTSEGR